MTRPFLHKDINESASILNNDLLSRSKWTYNWKITFNPDPTKAAQEEIFYKKKKKKIQTHPVLSLNNIQVEKVCYQKHLGILLDEKLNMLIVLS